MTTAIQTHRMRGRRLTLTHDQQMYLFRLLRPCVRWTDEKHPKPFVSDPIGERISHILWEGNLGLVHKAIVGSPWMYSYNDAFQSAALGLREGVLRFDPERGTMPSTYLMWWIIHEFGDARSGDQDNPIAVPKHLYSKLRRGEAHRPRVVSYHAMVADASQDGDGRLHPDALELHSDKGTFSPERAAMARQAFVEWRDKLRHAEAEVRMRHPNLSILLFSIVTGYRRSPIDGQGVKAAVAWSGLGKHDVQRRVKRVAKDYAHSCGMKREPFLAILQELVEFSGAVNVAL